MRAADPSRQPEAVATISWPPCRPLTVLPARERESLAAYQPGGVLS